MPAPLTLAAPAGLAAGSAGLPDLQLLFIAAALVVLAGLIAMTEAALSVISAARVAELVRDGSAAPPPSSSSWPMSSATSTCCSCCVCSAR